MASKDDVLTPCRLANVRINPRRSMGSESDSGSVVDGVERSNCVGCPVPSVRVVRLSTGCGFSSGVADASTCTGPKDCCSSRRWSREGELGAISREGFGVGRRRVLSVCALYCRW